MWTSPIAIATWKRFEQKPGYRQLKTWLRRLFGLGLRLCVEFQVEIIEASGWQFRLTRPYSG